MYIEASNNHGRNKFYTRGSHHEWYFPWALPSSKPQVVEAFHDSITRYIANMLSKSGGARPRRLSDSTTTSTDYESNVELSDYDEAVLAKSKQRVKARIKRDAAEKER